MVKVTINENLCKGCGLCVRACPKGVLALAKDKLNAKGYHPSGQVRAQEAQPMQASGFATTDG